MNTKYFILIFSFITSFINLKSQTAVSTYSNLSTAYDRQNNSYFLLGDVDFYWNLVSEQAIIWPFGTSTIATFGEVSYYNDAPTYVVTNNGNNWFPGIFPDRSINFNSTTNTSSGSLVTYKTRFNLPDLNSSSNRYSVNLKLSADDVVYEIKLNGKSKKKYFDLTNTYIGGEKPNIFEIPFCDTDFVNGENTLEVTIADAGGVIGFYGEVFVLQKTDGCLTNLNPCCSERGLNGSGFETFGSCSSQSQVAIPVRGEIIGSNTSQPAIPCFKGLICSDKNFSFNVTGCNSNYGPFTYDWNFGDGSPIVTTSSVNSPSHVYLLPGLYKGNVSIRGVNCSPVTINFETTVVSCSCENASLAYLEKIPELCKGTPIGLIVTSCNNPNATYNWTFSDGVTIQTNTPSVYHAFQTSGTHNVSVHIDNSPYAPVDISMIILVDECPYIKPCKDCISSFAPDAGTYIISLWVKEDKADGTVLLKPEFNNTGVRISFVGGSAITPVMFFPNQQKNKIIDGWQRIYEEFTVPAGAQKINIELINRNDESDGIDSYFDDIRIHPINSSYKSYVYDPVNLRLMAELDERNYATLYEYDEEGQLIRVKKETEKGIKTIKETRTSVKK